ncbi:TIM-barrel domain-containing protein [uncultured Bacteroides sp.]|uniref:glycoside hydrolase family 31 protein n=1 Tax=uncultured Bacteroides sp. TaxID=162156 RepID=UPI002AA75D83|nr:TIM-barrel domain-containing protein [uncultured Bacteroides sp.]
MKKRFFLYLSLLSVFLSIRAQTFERTNLGIKAKMQSMNLEVQFFSPKIVRVFRTPENTSVIKNSLSVTKQPEEEDLQIKKDSDVVVITSPKLIVFVNLVTGKVAFCDAHGIALFTEKDYGAQFTPVSDAGNATFSVRQAFMLDKDEAIYGLGQHQEGKMNQRNQKIYLRQANMNVCIPLIVSVKGYGVFWDNYSPTTFTDNPQEMAFDSEIGTNSDYYFLYGGGMEGVTEQLRDLTGQSPMLPLWAYGFFQSRERYKNQEEPVAVVAKYRELGVPLDCVIQDWQYWGKDSCWNAMSFDPSTYPDPRGMVDKVHAMNAKMMIVAWPGFGPNTAQYKKLRSRKMLINFDTWPPNSGTKPYDPYNPAARDIYWNYLNKGVFAKGFDGWWLDSTEPDHINMEESDFDQPTYLGTFRSVRNAFPLMTVGGVYTHQRSVTSDKRVCILTRSAFAGQQRYAANTWSGDVQSSWEALKRQIPAGLNFSLCGIPYWNTDIGGFFAGRWNKGGGAKNPDFQELYVRWMQFGTFSPMMRSHGTDIPREIYQFGRKGDWAFDAQEKFINLRYSLLPYIYATAWNVTHHSGSFMRALAIDFAVDKKVYNIVDEYMFGKSFLVAPVTDKGAKSRSVYLPANTLWYNFWNNEKYDGGQSITCNAPIDVIPLYVKAGSIIPWGPKVQYATEKKWDSLEIRIYAGADGTFVLYEDENDNYNYEKGLYSEIQMTWNDQDHTLTIGDRKGSFAGMLKKRAFKVLLMEPSSALTKAQGKEVVKTISYKGKSISIKLQSSKN